MRDLDIYYVLDGREVRATSQEAAYDWLLADENRKRVAEDTIGRFYVSTVFMIHDHNLVGSGPPIVFETMVFEQDKDGNLDMTGVYTDRCSTYDEAERMHARTCDAIRAGDLPEMPLPQPPEKGER